MDNTCCDCIEYYLMEGKCLFIYDIPVSTILAIFLGKIRFVEIRKKITS